MRTTQRVRSRAAVVAGTIGLVVLGLGLVLLTGVPGTGASDPTPGEARQEEGWATGAVRGVVRGGADAEPLADAFVYAKVGPHMGFNYRGDPEYATRVGIQEGRFVPHVVGAMVGERLEFVNLGDGELRVTARTPGRGARKVTVGAEAIAALDLTGVARGVELTHDGAGADSQRGFAFVLDHPFFAATDVHGHFEIPDLPAGDYVLVAWHESSGEHEFAVRVEQGEPADVTFNLQ